MHRLFCSLRRAQCAALTDYATLMVRHLTFPAMQLVNADTPLLPTAWTLKTESC